MLNIPHESIIVNMFAAFISAVPLTPTRSASPNAALVSGSNRCVGSSIIQCSTRRARFTVYHTSRCTVSTMSAEDKQPQEKSFLASAFDQFLTVARKTAAVAAVVALLAAPLNAAWAASGGGRIGGSQFRAPAMRSAPSAPSRSYGGGMYSTPPPSIGYGYGYGYGAPSIYVNPFIAPVGVGIGFGGLGTFLTIAFVASLVGSVLRSRANTASEYAADPTTAVAVFKVGLLSSARGLQMDLDTLARSADTSTTSGLSAVLEDTVTALLRHPDYWTHASVSVRSAPLSKAEAEFNRSALEERLKLDEETLINTSGRKRELARAAARDADISKAPGEYIVVTVVVAADGTVVPRLPKQISSVADVDRALRAFAALPANDLQAIEIIWAPQSMRDTLSEREMLNDHPELRRL